MSESSKSETMKRNPNFSSREEAILMECVTKFAHIIECKKSDTQTNRSKTDAWIRLAKHFNAASGEVSRTPIVLKNKYLNLKRRSKETFAANKRQLYGTGGGGYKKVPETDTDIKIQELIGPQMTGLQTEFDCDVETNESNVIETLTIDVEGLDDDPETWGASTPLDTPRSTILQSAQDRGEREVLEDGLQTTHSRPRKTPQKERKDSLRGQLGTWAERKAELSRDALQFAREEHLQKMRQREEEHQLRLQQSRERHEIEMEILKLQRDQLKKN